MDASGSKRQAKFAFVTVQPRDAGNEGGRSRAARSHAASVGYRKSQQAAKSKMRHRVSSRSDFRAAESFSSGPGNRSASSQHQHHRSDSVSSVVDETQCSPDGEEHVSSAVALPLAKSLSPAYGAGGLSTFDSVSDTLSAGTGSFMASVVWPVVAGDAISRQWFEDFCTSPIVFHAHCTAGDTYLAYLENDLTHINNNRTLVHKSKAINLIRQGIERIATMIRHEQEKLIFGMLILSNHEVEPRHLEERALPFRPHLPSANWFRCWGRTDAIEAHERTAFFLINQLGGLKALQMPGLAPMAALVDIFRRSSAVHDIRPDFDCYWDLHVSDLLPDYYESIISSPPSESSFTCTAGAGFSRLANVLPAKAITLFSDLPCLDMFMSQCLRRCSTNSKEQRFLDVRNAIIHRLLSLPSWDDLPAYEQDRTNRLLYKICCTTCLIYSNGAMLPMPSHNGWNARLTAQIRKLLEKTDMSYWHSSVQSLLLWTILISGMAAYETENRLFFEHALESYLSHRPLTYEQAILEVKNFIWSDSVCEIGSRELWKASLQHYDSPVV